MITRKSMEKYYEAYAQKVVNYLIASGLDYAAAADVTQSAFLKIWQKRETLSLENEDGFSGYVFTVARNELVDGYRKNSRIVFTDELPEPEHEDDGHDSGKFSRDEDYIRERISSAMNQLPDAIREAYSLFAVSECSVSEIARIMGCKESLVKVRLFRARQKLQALLADLKP